MKKVSILILALLPLLFACNKSKQDEVSEEVVTESDVESQVPGNYGEFVSEQGVVSLDQLYKELLADGEFEGKVVGQIKEVCTKKGCWMTLDLPNGETMRVTFKDYGFFVPLNAHGYPVIIEGVATRSVTDVATLKHYAEDAGKSKEEIDEITAPKEEYAFEAIGVVIKENA
ncbi:DUF4920 domain-containing protein [Belliella kenyensis]|uniref:DUF4920 domain-containing protein n=1 Tax=Belliella kenyensis TaxID=1472724 RepID=A0ABV8ENE9_9BACT|nr:DUF4920 domain-containing protein [Belliella kenyensis]MCH7401982.1 DUF4920 domain-containing protein [Belliella kenyensis]MDN3605146.1 DUF4920 domain-containing protein [Belliella kenyensis]